MSFSRLFSIVIAKLPIEGTIKRILIVPLNGVSSTMTECAWSNQQNLLNLQVKATITVIAESMNQKTEIKQQSIPIQLMTYIHQLFIVHFVTLTSNTLGRNFSTTQVVKDSEKLMNGFLLNIKFSLKLLRSERNRSSKLRLARKEV